MKTAAILMPKKKWKKVPFSPWQEAICVLYYRNMTNKKDNNNVLTLSQQAAELTQQLNAVADVQTLTDQDVQNFKATVALLNQQKDRLNEVLGILNQLPSGIADQWSKVNPDGRRY